MKPTAAKRNLRRIAADDAYFQSISKGWGLALKKAFDSLPDVTLDE